jgi:hypothetical protein
VYRGTTSILQDNHLAALEGAREESTLILRNFYKVRSLGLLVFAFYVLVNTKSFTHF